MVGLAAALAALNHHTSSTPQSNTRYSGHVFFVGNAADKFFSETGLRADELGRVGPLAKADMKRLFRAGTINMMTHVWAAGMEVSLTLMHVIL